MNEFSFNEWEATQISISQRTIASMGKKLTQANADIEMLNERLAERTSGLLKRHAEDIRKRQEAEVQISVAWDVINTMLLSDEFMADNFPSALSWLERNNKTK